MNEVRYATERDAPAMLPLLEALGYPCTPAELHKRIPRFLNNPDYGIAVYELNQTIVGLIAWSKSDLFVLDKVRFHIEGLIVSQSYQRMGIG